MYNYCVAPAVVNIKKMCIRDRACSVILCYWMCCSRNYCDTGHFRGNTMNYFHVKFISLNDTAVLLCSS